MASYVTALNKMFTSLSFRFGSKQKQVSSNAGCAHSDEESENWTPEKASKLTNKQLDEKMRCLGGPLRALEAKIDSYHKQLASLKEKNGRLQSIFFSEPRKECAKVRQALKEAKAEEKRLIEENWVFALEYRARHWGPKPAERESSASSICTADETFTDKEEVACAEPTPAEDTPEEISMIEPAMDCFQEEEEEAPEMPSSTIEVAATSMVEEELSTENNHAIAIVDVTEMDARPSIAREAALSPMDAMKQRLASLRSGIAPKDEDSLLVTKPMDDSFLAQLDDDEEEEKILAGRRSSTSPSCSSPKECASTVEVFAMAMSNRSLLDRAASMQSRSSSCDANTDVAEEEWV